jgi:ABC-type multidrug transport system ATPase subunit
LKKKQQLEQMDKIVIADTYMVFCDDFLYFVENKGGVSVVAHGLYKKVHYKKTEKYITSNVSLSIEPGEFVAIIGGSGAGKTTLLNCLSGMTSFTSGDVLINGESVKTNNRSIRSLIGYVPQNDIVYDNLTLEHMLLYSAKLRMPKDTSPNEIKQKIDETLKLVELDAHRNTMISKLSGGQKKRASIAVELLASPKLFFLDEPSSGLDPGTEKNLMSMLKKLALTGKTVIMVTHTVQNINMCDRVICMGKGGRLCYSGPPKKALEFFEKDNMTDIYEDLNEHSKEVSERFSNTANQMNQPLGNANREAEKKKGFDFKNGLRQFLVMTKRYAEITWNSKSRLLLLILMPVILTLLVCIAFQADGNLYNYLGLSVDRTSLPFLVGSDTMRLMFTFACAGFWVGIFDSIQEISKERSIYRREQFTGVRPFPYVMSKFAINCVLCLIQAAIMTAIFVWLTNTTATIDGDMTSATALQLSMNEGGVIFTNSGLWAELYITTFMSLLCAMSVGLAISAAVSNDMALVLCPICLLPQILFSGVACTLSGVTETISNFITCRWTCIAYFTSTAINDMYESCTYDTGVWTKEEFTNGFGIDEAYSSYKTYLFGLNPVWSAWLALIIMSVVCVALAIVLLYIKQHHKN